MPVLSHADRVRGSLFGLAYGDALAAEAEFLPVDAILARWPGGPRDLEGDPALITDDTQMATAVGEALLDAIQAGPTVENVQTSIAAKFAAWFGSSDNTRAPGLTCISAAARLSQGFPWHACTIIHSKGCGTTMRVAPTAMLNLAPDARTEDGAELSVSTLAQMQAAMTHGHPTALAAADLSAQAVLHLLHGGEAADLPAVLREFAETNRLKYHARWLGSLWELLHGVDSGPQYIAGGWAECLRALDRLDAALVNPDPRADPCDATGSGWVADEAMATSLLCFMLFPDDPVGALNRAAVTRGDSDSIAAMTGSLAGARHGFAAWPESWYPRIETRERLDALALGLARVTP